MLVGPNPLNSDLSLISFNLMNGNAQLYLYNLNSTHFSSSSYKPDTNVWLDRQI